MPEFKVIMHGAFAAAASEVDERGLELPSGISGFYATRIIKAANVDEAVEKAKEVIVSELDETLLRGRADLTVRFAVDECRKLRLFSSRLPDKGFTFY